MSRPESSLPGVFRPAMASASDPSRTLRLT